MYRCEFCDQIFEEPVSREESFGEYHGAVAIGSRNHCPHCGSDDISPMHRCVCGEWIDSEDDYCEACIDAAEDAVTELAKRLKLKRTDAEDLLLYILE